MTENNQESSQNEAPKEPDVKINNVQPEPQFLVMVDQMHMALLSKIIPGLKYVQVEGMSMTDNKTHQLLVNPLPKKPEEKPQEMPVNDSL